jgi:hypothetical protein
LLRDYGTWTDFCQLGESKIYERLRCKPDMVGEFIANELVCRRLRIAAMTLLDVRNRYVSWCDRWAGRGAYRNFFEQPSVAPIREELAKHNILCVTPGFDFTTRGNWKEPILQSDYRHKKYVVLGCKKN